MKQDIRNELFQSQIERSALLNTAEIIQWFKKTISLVIPEYSARLVFDEDAFSSSIRALESELEYFINISQQLKAVDKVEAFFDQLLDVKKLLDLDARAIFDGDPAAQSVTEVRYAYPSLYAIGAYRIAHVLDKLDIPDIPRIISEHAHRETGIDIHPSAQIGLRFCIDHGTGVVIGQSSQIGDDVKIYQGVTLGALSVSKTKSNMKRHPTIGDRVVLYAGATILGGKTTVGDDSIIGGNVWLVNSVPAHSKIYYQSPREIKLGKAV